MQHPQEQQQQQQHEVEDLSMYEALFDQFQSEVSSAEVGNILSLGVELDPDDEAGICRVPVSDFGDQAFVLRGILGAGECQRLVAAAEASGGLAPTPGFSEAYRSCHRVVLHEPVLAKRLYRRLLPHLPHQLTFKAGEDPGATQHVFGPRKLLEGDWKPSCLNPVLRLCRYQPGQHFAPHYDGLIVHDDNNRSMQTFMVYLTDNPATDGGATNFLDDSLAMSSLVAVGSSTEAQQKPRLSAPKSNITCQVHPERGAALVFNHYRLHEGEPLAAGIKYILRTDIMYRRVSTLESDPIQLEALRLLQEAERLERQGQAAAAVDLYRRAFRMFPELETCS